MSITWARVTHVRRKSVELRASLADTYARKQGMSAARACYSMRMRSMLKRGGFTLVELLVVIGILALLISVVLFSVSETREKARDSKRLSDMKSLQLAFKLYREAHSGYPTGYNDGTKLGVGNPIDTEIAPFLPNVPDDPRQSDDFYYQYDTSVECTDTGQVVLFAKTLETDAEKNYSSVCSCTSGCNFSGGRPQDGYVIILQ